MDLRFQYPLDWRQPIYNATIDKVALMQISDGMRTITQQGIYLQDHLEVERWNIVLGGRYDWTKSHNKNRLRKIVEKQRDTAFTGRVALLYAFDNGLSPYMSYSTSFLPTTLSGAPESAAFKPTEGRQIELGLKYQPVGHNMLFSVALFEINQSNVATLNPTTQFNEQVGKVRSRGFELETRIGMNDQFDLMGAYSYTDVKTVRTLNVREFGKAPTAIPKHVASLWSNYRFDHGPLKGLSFGAGARYVGTTFGDRTNSFKVPAHTNYDLMLRYDLAQAATKLDGATFQLNVKNVSNKRFVASCASALSCKIGAGRSLNAALVIRF